MDWRWTQHILLQLKERQIRKDLVETTLVSPDKIIEGKKNRMIYQKIISGKLLRVVAEGDLLITVYLTDKINKYHEGGD
jgi:translation elongation factor EF-Ts